MFLTEEALAQGELVAPSKANDYQVIKAGASATNAFGIAYKAAGAGEFVEVILAARAQVLMKDSTAVVHGDVLYASATAGRMEVSSAGGGGVIGQALETVAGGTDVLVWAHIYLQPTAGSVGIGTTNPTTALDVNGTVKATALSVTTVPTISTGTAAPSSTPGKIGDIYVDYTNHKFYFAECATSSACWIIAN